MNKRTLETVKNWEAMPHEYVDVDWDKLYRDTIARAPQELVLNSWEFPGVHPIGHRVLANHNFWWNAVNFQFSYWHTSAPDGSMKKFQTTTVFWQKVAGAFAMKSCFYREFFEKEILAHDMRRFLESLRKTKRFFRGRSSIPMAGERRELLLEACVVLEKYFKGDPWNIYEAGNFRAYGDCIFMGIVDLLKFYFPKAFGSDVWSYKHGEETLEFNFDKRAHLLVMIYHGRAAKYPNELSPIKDISELGPCPDYELPRSYEADGIFRFGRELKTLIAMKIPVKAGSHMELEIRGATAAAQVKELEWGNEERKRLGLSPQHMGHVDFYRWSRGKKLNTNHFLCKTTAY